MDHFEETKSTDRFKGYFVEMNDPLTLENLIGTDPIPFHDLLTHFASPESLQRTSAEAAFNALKEQCPERLVIRLVEFVKNENAPPQLRALSATLLRQVLTKEQPSIWTSVSKPIQDQIRMELLDALIREPERDVGIKVADVVADLFVKILGSDCWPELIPFLCDRIQRQQSQSATLVEFCVHILAEIAPVLTDSMEQSVPRFISMIQQSLDHPDRAIQLACFRSIKSLALALEDLAEVAQLKVLMPLVLIDFASFPIVTHQATEAHAILIEMAQYVPSLFEDVIRDVLEGFLSRLIESGEDLETKTMALEFLLTMMENLTDAQIETVQNYLTQFFSLLMDGLLTIEEKPDWFQHLDAQNYGSRGQDLSSGFGKACDFVIATNASDRNHDCDLSQNFGEMHNLVIESFDRLASGIPSSVFLTLFSPFAQQWSKDGDWKKRHAVLSVIGQMAEGCSSEIVQSAQSFLEICDQGLKDPHVRVRWAACQALGLVADELNENLTKDQKNHLVCQLLQTSVIDDPGAVAVHEHALLCACNVLGASDDALNPNIFDDLIRWILQSLKFANTFVIKAALQCLSCVTSISKAPAFAKYYDETMKAVFNTVNSIQNPTHLEEITAIVLVMTRIGCASGKDCFVKDYRFIVDYLKSLMFQCLQLQDLDIKRSIGIYILNAVELIGSIMKREFDALDVFKDLLLEALGTEPKVVKVSQEEMEESEDDAFKIDIAGKCFRMDKMSMDFCKCGMTTAMSLASDLKETFFPLLCEVLEVFLSAIDCKILKEIQEMGIQVQPILLECATERQKTEPTEDRSKFILTLFSKQWEIFMEKMNMENESNETSVSIVLEAVAGTLQVMQGNVDPSMMQKLFERLQNVIQHFLKLRSERAAIQENELYDEELEEFQEEVSNETGVFQSIQKVLQAILMHTQDRYYDSIRGLVSLCHTLMTQLQNAESDEDLLDTIFTIMTDLCEFSPMGREQFAADICDLFSSQLNHLSSAIRQSTAFGIGVIAQKTPILFQSRLHSVIANLIQVIETTKTTIPNLNDMTDDQGYAFDNAISTIGKIVFTYPQSFSNDDRQRFIELWMSHLPLRYDMDEAFANHSQLIKAVESGDVFVLGPNQRNLAAAIGIFMEVLANEKALASKEVLVEMSSLLKRFEHENACGPLAMQKMNNWSESKKARFAENMSTIQT